METECIFLALGNLGIVDTAENKTHKHFWEADNKPVESLYIVAGNAAQKNEAEEVGGAPATEEQRWVVLNEAAREASLRGGRLPKEVGGIAWVKILAMSRKKNPKQARWTFCFEEMAKINVDKGKACKEEEGRPVCISIL